MRLRETPENYLRVAKEAAFLAGALQIKNYGKLKSNQIHTKSKNDFVTEIDKKSEKIIISTIRRYFPHHSIQGEESGLSLSAGSALWIIDPLDGTANYIHQFPMFSVSIGVLSGKTMQAGLIHDPLHKETFSAIRGQGARLNSAKIEVTRVRRLADSLMTTGIPFRARGRFDEYMASFREISLSSQGMRRGGSAALDLAYVACGRLDGFWEINLSPWDIAAGSLIITEAGGRVSDLWGRPDFMKSGDILASNGYIHSELKRITGRLFTPKEA